MRNGLNMEETQKRIVRTVSRKEALKDVIQFQYSQEVKTRRSKVALTMDPAWRRGNL